MSGRLLTPELEALIGTERTYTAPEPVGRASIRYFALAIGDDNLLYTDTEFAQRHGYADVIAPPTFVCETNQYMTGPPDREGYIGHRWEIEVPGTRLIRGGHRYTFHRPLYPEDRLAVRWRIADMKEKTSSQGKAMLVTTSEARYETTEGELLAINQETLIYQEL